MSDIKIRAYLEADAPALAAIYYHTIHTINIRDYSEEQVNAWAPYDSVEDYSGWQKKLAKIQPFVAVLNDTIVGFAEFEPNGHIDCFYVHHAFQGKGVGSVLMAAIVDKAKKEQLVRIFAEVSITARPFFEARGFQCVKEQQVTVRGVELTNFVMERHPTRFTLCTSEAEWRAATHYRHKYFFGKVPMDDPYLWTFGHPEHRHFALYQAADIIGYAHIQLWPDARAALRIIVIDEDKRNRNHGSECMEQIEAWVKAHGYNVLHTEASPAALVFYTKRGYSPMPFDDPNGDECGPPDTPLGKRL